MSDNNHERHLRSLVVNVHSWMASRDAVPTKTQWKEFKEAFFAKYRIWDDRERAIQALDNAAELVEKAGGDSESIDKAMAFLLDADFNAGLR